jgi:predicted anti-sigma-YlaC factor YlaD
MAAIVRCPTGADIATHGNILAVLRDYRGVDCEVAREALSARLDGEREPVPSARVDEHLDECADCRGWFDHVSSQALGLRRLVQSRPVIAPVGPIGTGRVPPRRRSRMWQQWALLCVGIAQIVLATVQGLGLSVGLTHDHSMGSAGHLLNESTAWSIALGVVMVVAALRPRAAAGLAGVLAVFVGVLTVYVVADAVSGAVTTARMLTHLPAVIGAFLAIMVWRGNSAPRPTPDEVAAEPDIVLPQNASRGRRRGHLWPTDGSAA